MIGKFVNSSDFIGVECRETQKIVSRMEFLKHMPACSRYDSNELEPLELTWKVKKLGYHGKNTNENELFGT